MKNITDIFKACLHRSTSFFLRAAKQHLIIWLLISIYWTTSFILDIGVVSKIFCINKRASYAVHIYMCSYYYSRFLEEQIEVTWEWALSNCILFSLWPVWLKRNVSCWFGLLLSIFSMIIGILISNVKCFPQVLRMYVFLITL